MRRDNKQPVVVDGSPWVRVVEYNRVVFDEGGFQYPGEDASRVQWRSVLRVAIGYEIHPLVVVDWNFVAFQCADEDITYRVQTEFGDAFTSEVRRRFGTPDIPPMQDWADREFCIRTYTIWPHSEIGRPMFRNVKRHRWSWRSRMAFTKIGQQGLPPQV